MPPCLINVRLRPVCGRCIWTLANLLISQYLSLPLQWLVISFLWLLSQISTNLVAETIKICFFHNSRSQTCVHNILLPPWRRSSRGLDWQVDARAAPGQWDAPHPLPCLAAVAIGKAISRMPALGEQRVIEII